jgi:hypothetical protein
MHEQQASYRVLQQRFELLLASRDTALDGGQDNK